MGNFARVLHHLDMKDVKRRHLKELAARKIKEEQDQKEGKIIQEIAKKHKSDWRKELEEDFTVVSNGPTNSATQTFQHASGQNFSFSGIGGQEGHPSFVTVAGDIAPAPNYNQLAIAGYVKPLGNVLKRKELEDTNSKLDASQEFAKKVGADVMMNARVKTGELSLEQKKEFVEIYKNDIEEWNKKSAEIANENVRRRKSNISKVRSFVSKFGENLDDIKGVQTFVKIAQGGKKLIVINQDNIFRDFSNKFNVRVYEAEEGKVITKQRGNFGRVDSSIFDNPFTNRKSSGQATIMYDGVGGEVENKTFAIKELSSIPMPTPPKFMQKNIDKGWQPSVTSSFDQEFINKMNIWFNTLPKVYSSTVENFTSGANFPAILAINLAKGNLDPVTKSPGRAVTHIIKKNIEFVLSTGKTEDLRDFDDKGNKLDPELKKHHSFFNPITGKGAVRYNAYGDFGVTSAPVSASLGQYSIERTDKGIRISDKFDISGGFTAPGGADFFSGLTKLIGGRDVQLTGETLTAIAARRAAELGYDMVDADTGETLKPVYSGEEEYNSRLFKNDPNAPTIATPKGYNIKIDFTIPWSSFSPETATLLKIGGSKKVDPLQTNTDRTGYGYDTKGKLDSSGYGMDPNRDTETEARPIKTSKAVKRIKSMSKTRNQSLSLDEPIVRRKKKRG